MKKKFLKFGIFILTVAMVISASSFAVGLYPEHLAVKKPARAKNARYNIVYDNTDHGDHRNILENVVKFAAIAENANVWLYPTAGKEAPILVEPTQECTDKLFTSYIKASNELKPEDMISTALSALENDPASSKELILFLDTDSMIANNNRINELQNSGSIPVSEYHTSGYSARSIGDDYFFEGSLKKLGYASCTHTYDPDTGIISIEKGAADRNIVVIATKDRDDFEYISGRDLDEEYMTNATLFINGYLADSENHSKNSSKSNIKGVALSYNHINFTGVHSAGSDITEDKAIALFTADGTVIDPLTEDLVIPVANAGTVEVYYKSSPGAGICSAETEYNLKQCDNAPIFTSTGFAKEENPLSGIFPSQAEKEGTSNESLIPQKTAPKKSNFSVSGIFSFILKLIALIISLAWRLFWLGLLIFGIVLIFNPKVRSNTHEKLSNSKLAPAYKAICDIINELKSLFTTPATTTKPPVKPVQPTQPARPAYTPHTPAKDIPSPEEKVIFISYSSADYKDQHNRISVIKTELARRGIKCWISAEGIKGGRDFSLVLPQVISNCAMVLLFLSPNSCNSVVVGNEIHTALSENKPIFPVKIVDFALFEQFPNWKFNLTNTQVKEAYSNKADVIKKIVDEIEELYNEL